MFTTLSSALAVVGHHLAAGDPVPWQRLAGGAAVAFALSLPLTRTSRPWWHVVSMTGVAQLALHRALFVQHPVFHGHAEAHGTGPQIVRASAHHGTWAMAAAHGVATCAMALLMYRADQVLSRLPETVDLLVQRAAAAAAAGFGALYRPWQIPLPRTAPVPRSGLVVGRAVATTLCHTVVRRGPPVAYVGDVPPSPLVPRGSSLMTRAQRLPRLPGLGLTAFGALVVLGIAAGPAAAHAGVTASDPRALAENVTLSFTSEAESDSAGIAELRVVLPKGITPDAVTLKDAPEGWKLTATPDGYSIGGTALATGTDAEYSITVRQLPDEKALAFKTLETYGDGKVSRWIEVPANGEKVDNPAPVLELKAAAPGAKPIAPSPSPSPTPPPSAVPSEQPSAAAPSAPSGASSTATTTATTNLKGAGSGTGVVLGSVAATLVLAAAGAFWWLRRSRNQV
ncbi:MULTISPECIES: DUF1775 domain-containing protein [unclassified Streptomyces]|uniref:DUF1775 domain-containing protein n=1 Tax=unclassified Streptomyces TaxID=2593676 RepID=UPI002E29B001|nr:DUF1775 domain-containing protein [Streptomyces sp. NBC_01439]